MNLHATSLKTKVLLKARLSKERDYMSMQGRGDKRAESEIGEEEMFTKEEKREGETFTNQERKEEKKP